MIWLFLFMSLSGRTLIFIIPVMLISISLIHNIEANAEGPVAFGPHWVPSDPQTEEEFEFFIYVTISDQKNVENIFLHINGEDHPLIDFSKTSDENKNGTLYHSSLTLDRNGVYSYNVTLEINGTIIYIYHGEIEILESEADNDKDTILGLPRWWCSVSVIFGTIFLIFLTWAYFKGRSLKRSELNNLQRGITCSSCGDAIGIDDTECSKCGSTLNDLEYICGNCGENVDHGSKKCSHCGSRLKGPDNMINDEHDHDLKKLKGTIDMSGKANCPYCNGIISSSDMICPACKRNL